MSAHHPFNIPENKVRFELPERYRDTLVGQYIQAQNYADYAVGQLIDRLKQQGLWDNTMLVIYGDHLGLPIYSLTDHEKKLMTEIYGREYQFTEMLNIPLIVAAPEVTEPKTFPQTGGQVDVFPTLANLLGVSLKGHIHFGQDLLNNTGNVLPQRYYLPSGSFVNGKGILFRDSATRTESAIRLTAQNPLEPILRKMNMIVRWSFCGFPTAMSVTCRSMNKRLAL